MSNRRNINYIVSGTRKLNNIGFVRKYLGEIIEADKNRYDNTIITPYVFVGDDEGTDRYTAEFCYESNIEVNVFNVNDYINGHDLVNFIIRDTEMIMNALLGNNLPIITRAIIFMNDPKSYGTKFVLDFCTAHKIDTQVIFVPTEYIKFED